jgi:uncharacterized protein YbjT (DUF2867 family)
MAGDAGDTEFLVKAFQGADAVFTLLPPDPAAADYHQYADRIGESIARALEISRIDHVVNLSSIGAEMPSGTGPIAALHRQEERLNTIAGLNVLHLRAAYFMENVLMNIPLIKSQGMNGTAIRGDLKMSMIATKDIAAFAAERLWKRDFPGSSVRYLLGKEDITLSEATMTIGIRIGKPNLPYLAFSYADAEEGMVRSGLSRNMSKVYVEMNRAFNEGRIGAKRSAENTTQTSFSEFCEEIFVPLYMGKVAA